MNLSFFYNKYFKLNDKTQPIVTVLLGPHNHTHPYINNTLISIYITNKMLKQLLFLLFLILESLTL